MIMVELGTGTGFGQVLVLLVILFCCYQRQEINITRDGINRHGEGLGHQNLNCNGKPGLDAVLCRASICGVSLANIPRAYKSPWKKQARINSGGSDDQSTLLMPLPRFIIILRGAGAWN
jgi:hypothetical protein